MRVREQGSRRAFTMTEMLVVMGICGVLAMLLVPMVLKSRSAAQSVVCTDNLKAVGQAFAISMVQSNGYLPDTYYVFGGHDGVYDVTFKTTEMSLNETLLKGDLNDALACPADSSPVSVAMNTVGGTSTTVPASYAYNIALPLMFRNVSRVSQPVNTVTFYDGDASGVVGQWQHTLGWAGDTIRNRHNGSANYLYLDGHVEASAAFPDLAFESGGGWVASARDTRPPAEPTPPATPDDDDDDEEPEIDVPPVDISIEDGSAIPNQDCKATIICIGAAFQNGAGGARIPVTAYYKLDGDSTRITPDVLGGETVVLNHVQAGTPLAIRGKTSKYYSCDRSSDDGSGHTWAFRDGDTVPSIAGFDGQRSLEEFLSDYIDEDGIVTIGKNDVIFLFELSDQIDYRRYSHADFQDLVVLIRFEADTYGVGGKININPNNRTDNEFTLILPDGYTITRDDLHSDNPHQNHDGFHPDYLEYNGQARLVMVKPKGNGNQNGMTVDGEGYRMLNKYRYTVTSTDMEVHLYNDKRNKTGKSMGKWWIEIDAEDATIRCERNGN